MNVFFVTVFIAIIVQQIEIIYLKHSIDNLKSNLMICYGKLCEIDCELELEKIMSQFRASSSTSGANSEER